MDGVVSNGALVAGVAAAHASTHTVILSGLAGLLAGSFSMAVGEWTSVQSQAQLVQAEIENERAEIARSPRAEEAELAALFRPPGLSRELATRVARELSQDPDESWRVHVREELGVDPDEQPSPYVAAVSSFVTFGIGALIPLLPYLLGATRLLFVADSRGGRPARPGRRRRPVHPTSAAPRSDPPAGLGAVTVAVVFAVGSAIGAGVERVTLR